MPIIDGVTSKDKKLIYNQAKGSPPDPVGEPFKEYVNDQIKVRQKTHGSGFGTERSKEELLYFNSKNSWVRMASSIQVGLTGEDFLKENPDAIGINAEFQQANDEAVKKLQDLGLTPDQYQGIRLAKEGVLFNGIWDIDKKTFKSGVATSPSKLNNSVYGFGGKDFGLQPMPGIVDFEIGHLNMGSLRSATINIRAHNRFQFDLISLLYIRLGYNMLIEWGNSLYLDNNGKLQKMGPTLMDDEKNGWFSQKGTSHLEFFNLTEAKRKEYNGNYDAFFGKVTNFDYSFEMDGSYSISLSLISLGDVVESFNLNTLDDDLFIPFGNQLKRNKLLNINNILNSIYCLKNHFNNIVGHDPNSSTITEEVKPNIFTEDNNIVIVSEAGGIEKGTYLKYLPKTTQLPYKETTYIKFKLFLETLNELLNHFTNKSSIFPELTINVSKTNYCKNFPGLVSFNPDICVINNDMLLKEVFDGFDNFKPSFDETPELTSLEKEILDETEGEGTSKTPGIQNPFLGSIMDIYLNVGYLEESIHSKIQNGDLPLFKLLDDICNDINNSLADTVQLKPTLQDESIVVIRDFNLDVKTGEDGNIIEKNSQLINVFGVNPETKESNFVKSFNFNTNISKNTSNMMTIGATAVGKNTTGTSGFFDNLNKGLIDRFKEYSFPRNPEYEMDCGRDKKNNKKSSISPGTGTGIGMASLLNSYKSYNDQLMVGAKVGGKILYNAFLEANGFIERRPTIEKYQDWLQYNVLSGQFKTEQFDYGNTGAWSYSYSYYSRENGGWDLGKSLWKEYLNTLFGEKIEGVYSVIGFIPMNVELTIEGLSGVKIYNQLVIDTSHFPSGYPDNIELVVVGVDHQIQDNSWQTNIRAITKPGSNALRRLPKPLAIDETGDGTNEPDIANPLGSSILKQMDDYPVFFPNPSFAPIESNPNVTFTSGPQAGRKINSEDENGKIITTQKDHFGIDFAASEGLDVYAVTDGVVKKAPPNPKGWGNNFVYIEETRTINLSNISTFETLIHIYGHLGTYREELIGQYVTAGTVIGTIGDEGSPGSFHLHYEVRKGAYSKSNKKFRGWKNPVVELNKAYSPTTFPNAQIITENLIGTNVYQNPNISN